MSRGLSLSQNSQIDVECPSPSRGRRGEGSSYYGAKDLIQKGELVFCRALYDPAKECEPSNNVQPPIPKTRQSPRCSGRVL